MIRCILSAFGITYEILPVALAPGFVVMTGINSLTKGEG
jgi:hypothetical protein